MTRSQSLEQKSRDRFQNPRRTQNYPEYSVRSNSFLFSYQYQDAYSSYQPFYRQLNARQYDRLEYQNRDNRNPSPDSRYSKKKSSESASVLSPSKQSLQIIGENNANASDSTFRETKSRNQRNNKSKDRVYVTEEHDQKDEREKSYDEDDYYHESNPDLNYYNPHDQNDEPETNFFTSARTFDCRKCKSAFSFNNQLHKHIRQNICENFKSLINHLKDKTSNEVNANLAMNISIIESTVDFSKNIDTDFEFRD
jgi:DNA-directed RNA polymerase subunit M/transcription elongation factor TFIIS